MMQMYMMKKHVDDVDIKKTLHLMMQMKNMYYKNITLMMQMKKHVL